MALSAPLLVGSLLATRITAPNGAFPRVPWPAGGELPCFRNAAESFLPRSAAHELDDAKMLASAPDQLRLLRALATALTGYNLAGYRVSCVCVLVYRQSFGQ